MDKIKSLVALLCVSISFIDFPFVFLFIIVEIIILLLLIKFIVFTDYNDILQ